MPEKRVTAVPDTEAATQPVIPFAELTARVAGEFAIEPRALWDALKTEFFPGGAASDAQMFLALQVIDKTKLNPFLKEIYATVAPKSGKLLIGVQYDGFITIAHRNPHYKGYQFERERDPKTGKVVAIICKIYRDDWEHPGEYYASMDEWYIADRDTWKTRPVHQLGVKAFNNCVRLTLGLSGIYDSDDIERIQAAENKPTIETTSRKIETQAAAQVRANEPIGQVTPMTRTGQENAHSLSDADGQSNSAPDNTSQMNAYIPTEGLNTSQPEQTARSATTDGESSASATTESETKGGEVYISEASPPLGTDNVGAAGITAETLPQTPGNNGTPAASSIRDKLAKLLDRTPPARMNLLLGQQGVARVEDLSDDQARVVVARLSKGAK